MALPRVPFMTGGGAEHSAEQVRLMMRGILGDDANGVVGSRACRVLETAVPGGQVRITDGGVNILGRVLPWQGVYTAYNIGDELVDVPATGAQPRNDLLVVRVEDPQYEGTLDPLVDNIIFPLLLSNVPAGTETTADAGFPGMTAVPLARLEIPASTATITNSMIFGVADGRVRKLARPRGESFQDSVQHPGPTEALTSTSFVNWPTSATQTVRVPTWATRMDVAVTVFSAHLVNAGANGELRITVDGAAGDSIGWYNGNLAGTNHTVGTAATFGVAASAGQNVVVELQGNRQNGSGELRADTNTSSVFQIFFREEPEF